MLGAVVARIDRAFHGLESQEAVMGNPDLVDKIVRQIDSVTKASTLARTNKTSRESVEAHWALFLELCRFMDSLVDKTVANASDRQIDVCRLGVGKYLMRLVDETGKQTAMGYVVVNQAGATVTTLRWLQQGTGERFSMHEYANVCVSIRARISNIDDLRSDLAAWGLKKSWSANPTVGNVDSEVCMVGQHYIDTHSGTVFDDAPALPRGLYIWKNQRGHWQFEYRRFDRRPVNSPELVRGTIIRTGDTALVWGFAQRVGRQNAFDVLGGQNPFDMLCYSMRADICSSQELYNFIRTHEWTNPETVLFEHPIKVTAIECRMHPRGKAPSVARTSTGLHSAAAGVSCRRMLGALVARIDGAFHGLESQEAVMGNPDLVDRIVRQINSSKTASTLARTNKTAWKSVQDQWALYFKLCEFMNTLVDETVAEVRERKMDACRLGPGKYLMQLVDKTGMGYVVVRLDGTTMTTFSRMSDPDVCFDMHLYTNVCVRIKVCISNPDDLLRALAAWGRKQPWSFDVESEVGANCSTAYIEKVTCSETVFDGAPPKPRGLYIWRNANDHWQFEYTPNVDTSVRGTIIRTGATALVWGFAERHGGRDSWDILCYSMRADIRASQELYAFITTHEWTNPEKVMFEHPVNSSAIKRCMHPRRGAPGMARASTGLHSAAAGVRARMAALERFVGCADGGGVQRVKLHVVLSRCSSALRNWYGDGVQVAYLEVHTDFAALLVGSAGVLYKSNGEFPHSVGQPGAFYGLTGDDANAITLSCYNIASPETSAYTAGFSLVKAPWVGEWTVCGKVEVEGELFRRIGQSAPDAWDPQCAEISIPAANTTMTLRWAGELENEWRMANVKSTGFEVSDPAHPGISLRCGVSVRGYNDIRLSVVRGGEACVNYALKRKGCAPSGCV
jgi:hypothetical protein